MANENKNNENKNNAVTNPTMTNEQMEQFVKDNISIVPRNQAKKFESLKLEQKVSKIRFYIDIQKMKEDAKEKNKLENKVKDLFIRRKATTEDVLRVIEFCKKYNVETPDAPIPKYFIEDLSELYDKVKMLPKTKKCVDVFMSW